MEIINTTPVESGSRTYLKRHAGINYMWRTSIKETVLDYTKKKQINPLDPGKMDT